jgi:hypothetical protein
MEKTSGKGLANGHSNGRALDQVSGPQLPATADFSAPKTSLEGPPGELKVTVPRRYTKPGINPLDALHWTRRKSVIADPDGTVVFKMDDAEVPEDWSQLATDVAVSKYFRKAGVPGTDHEKSVRQLVERVAKTIRSEGVLQGLLATPEIADTFEAELSYMLIRSARLTRRCGSTAASITSTASPARAGTSPGTRRRTRSSRPPTPTRAPRSPPASSSPWPTTSRRSSSW